MMTAVENSKDEEEKHFCRLCHGTDEDEDAQMDDIDQEWVQPCKCSGSIKWVHRGCFKAWHNQASYEQRTQCSICSHVFRFSSRLKPRWYAKLPVIYWLSVLLTLVAFFGLFYYISTFDTLDLILYTGVLYAFLIGLKVALLLFHIELDESGDERLAELLLTCISYALFDESIQNAE